MHRAPRRPARRRGEFEPRPVRAGGVLDGEELEVVAEAVGDGHAGEGAHGAGKRRVSAGDGGVGVGKDGGNRGGSDGGRVEEGAVDEVGVRIDAERAQRAGANPGEEDADAVTELGLEACKG